MATVLIRDFFLSTHRRVHTVDAQKIMKPVVPETPGRPVVGGQFNAADVAVRPLQSHDELGVCTLRRVQPEQDRCVVALDVQQGLPRIIGDAPESLVRRKCHVIQGEAMSFERHHTPGQRDPVTGAAHHLQLLDEARLMDHAKMVIVLFVEVEAVDFLLRHQQLVARGAVGLEGFAAAQGNDLVAGRVLGQLQIPAQAKAAVLSVERVVIEGQRQSGAAQPVGFDIGQGNRNRVLSGPRVDPAGKETHEIECIGMHGSCNSHR